MSLSKLLNGNQPIGAYFQSWSSSWQSDPNKLDLANLSKGINIVFLSFVNPSCSYQSNSFTLSGTGLDFSSDFSVVKGAINILHQKGVIVMLSVGGATYPFTNFNPQSVANLMNDLGADGIDIDFEETNGTKLPDIIRQTRSAIGSGKLLSIAGFSVGAYGEGAYVNSQPAGSAYTGVNLPLLKSDAKGQVDFINIMSYDASNAYNPIEAYQAYRSYFSGPLLIGFEVPPEAWGGHTVTIDEVNKIKGSISVKTDGFFVWSYQKPGSPSCSDIINAVVPSSNVVNQPIIVSQPTVTPQPSVPQSNSTNSWNDHTSYKVGDQVTYNGNLYTCITPHPSLSTWTPDVAVSLWKLIGPVPTNVGVGNSQPVQSTPSVVSPPIPVVNQPVSDNTNTQPINSQKYNISFDIDSSGNISNQIVKQIT